MKTVLKKSVFFTLIIVTLYLCCSCGKADPIIGTWQACDFDDNGTMLSETAPENEMLISIKKTPYKMEFFKDGSFKVSTGDNQGSGNWLSITREADDYPTYSIEPDDDYTVKAYIKNKKLYVEMGFATMVLKK